jgi:acetyl esterase/lipase
VLVTGDAAGGYMALMSGLTQPKGSIQAVLVQYPMTEYLRREKKKMHLDRPSPRPCLIDEHIAGIIPGRVVSCATPPSRMRQLYALSAYRRYLEFFGPDKRLWPVYLIEYKDYIPPTWIVHGDADLSVSVEDSRKFVEKCGEFAKGCEVRLEVRKGMEHGFDSEMKEDEEMWLKEGLQWVEGKWLGQSEPM